jgi:ABC-type branched-subunit amino acid transport system substrate-binding protein
MWQGINAAYQKSPHLERLRQVFDLAKYDDGSVEKDAENIAKEIQSNPRVLAVIGHAASSTTESAAWHYEEVGIPILMPIATSPGAIYAPGAPMDPSHRLQNCFRLPPNDERVQAPTVAFVAETKIHTKRTYLIRDISSGAAAYSEPLFKQLEFLLGDTKIDETVVDRENARFIEVATNIKAQEPDLIVFCGYGSTAKLIITALRDKYENVEIAKRPKIILTDGSKIRDLNASGFDVYLTFPLPTIDYFSECSSPDLAHVKATIDPSGEQSFQIYGYDAMLMIGMALEKCPDSDISRDCLRRSLGSLPLFNGSTCLSYFFSDGENSLSEYYVFRSNTLAPAQVSGPRTTRAGGKLAPVGVAPTLNLAFKVTKQDLDNYLDSKDAKR